MMFRFFDRSNAQPDGDILVAPEPETVHAKQAASDHQPETPAPAQTAKDAMPGKDVQQVGALLFKAMCQLLRDEKGVRAERILGALASLGGYACVKAAYFDSLAVDGAELTVIHGPDGQAFVLGNMPLAYLLEGDQSLLSLALSKAQEFGANVTFVVVEETFLHLTETVGTPEFGVPRLPAENQLAMLPIQFVQKIWPQIQKRLLAPSGLQPCHFASAFGHALQYALDATKEVIHPEIALRIILDCAVPMSKVDPHRAAA